MPEEEGGGLILTSDFCQRRTRQVFTSGQLPPYNSKLPITCMQALYTCVNALSLCNTAEKH